MASRLGPVAGNFDAYRYRFRDHGSEIDFKRLNYKKQPSLAPQDVEHAVSFYDAELAYRDEDRLVTLLKWPREWRQYDDSLIVVTSDHGKGLYDSEGASAFVFFLFKAKKFQYTNHFDSQFCFVYLF